MSPEFYELSQEEYEEFVRDMEEYNKYLARVTLGLEEEENG